MSQSLPTMAIHTLPSIDDPRLDPYRDLPRSSVARDSGRFVVEGRLLVERLLKSDYEVDSILVNRGRGDLLPEGIADETPVFLATDVDQIIGFDFHRGILACGRRRAGPSLQTAISANAKALTIVICVDVCDPANLGGILRNGAAFGADVVLVNNHCADPWSRRVLRVSMGAVLTMPIVESDDIAADLYALQRDMGVQLIATVLREDAEPLKNVARSARIGLLFGNEGRGLPPEVVGICDRVVTIPMRPNTDSLNAAVASGVFLHHFAT